MRRATSATSSTSTSPARLVSRSVVCGPGGEVIHQAGNVHWLSRRGRLRTVRLRRRGWNSVAKEGFATVPLSSRSAPFASRPTNRALGPRSCQVRPGCVRNGRPGAAAACAWPTGRIIWEYRDNHRIGQKSRLRWRLSVLAWRGAAHAQGATSANSLEEVVVTATRREQSVLEIRSTSQSAAKRSKREHHRRVEALRTMAGVSFDRSYRNAGVATASAASTRRQRHQRRRAARGAAHPLRPISKYRAVQLHPQGHQPHRSPAWPQHARMGRSLAGNVRHEQAGHEGFNGEAANFGQTEGSMVTTPPAVQHPFGDSSRCAERRPGK